MFSTTFNPSCSPHCEAPPPTPSHLTNIDPAYGISDSKFAITVAVLLSVAVGLTVVHICLARKTWACQAPYATQPEGGLYLFSVLGDVSLELEATNARRHTRVYYTGLPTGDDGIEWESAKLELPRARTENRIPSEF